jgi:hypothetical protein
MLLPPELSLLVLFLLLPLVRVGKGSAVVFFKSLAF